MPSIYAMPSLRVYSGRQPWNNLIRNVLMCSSAIIGGAEGFKCIPYDVLNTEKKMNALRESTNVPLLLRQEAHLQDVLNPLDGSTIYAATIDVLCKDAWDFFKEIEKKGGIFEAVRTGWLQMELSRQSDVTVNQVKKLENSLIGVNEFVDKRFHYGHRDDNKSALVALENIIDPLFLDKQDDEYMSVQPLVITSLTQDWEVLQEKWAGYKKNKIKVIKSPSAGVDKKIRLLTRALDVVGGLYEINDDTQITSSVESGDVVVLVVGDPQKEKQLVTELKSISGTRVISFFTSTTSEATHIVNDDIAPFDLAERIVEIVSGAQ